MSDKIYSIEEIKEIVAPIAKQYGVEKVYLFGSYARGEATKDSDIDLIIDTTGTEINTLFKLGEVYEEFLAAFDKPIDMITVSSLEQKAIRKSEIEFRKNIERERINLYAVA